MINQLDNESCKRGIKYIIQAIIIGLACYTIPQQKLKLTEIISISLIASISFAILDITNPSISKSVRDGPSDSKNILG